LTRNGPLKDCVLPGLPMPWSSSS